MKTNLQHWTSDQEKLEEFIFHRIDKIEEKELRAHLNICEQCQKRVQDELELLTGIRRFGRVMMKQRLRQHIRRDRAKRFEWTQVASIAAALVLMFAVVFIVRWFTEIEQNKTRTREIILKENESSQHTSWIIGKIIIKQQKFQNIPLKRSSSFVVKHGNVYQTISIRRFDIAELPSSTNNINKSLVHTLVEKTPDGLQMTLYTNITSDTLASDIEAVTSDSLIVHFPNYQIAYHIPGGWKQAM
jgi:hypothetical protein